MFCVRSFFACNVTGLCYNVFVNKAKLLYTRLEKMLIEKGYITLQASNIICRRGTRKEWIWKRHVLDLCEFVIDCREPDDKTKELLQRCAEWCKL